jgi:hypothetical protein
MPVYQSQTVLEIARGIKAFLGFRAGITRGPVPPLGDPEPRPERAAGGGPKKEKKGEGKGSIDPAKIVWILGSPRTGSTWLGNILGEPRGFAVWKEPFFGVVLGFRDNLANQGYVESDQFLLGEPHKKVWIGSMRRLFLDVGESKFPNISRNHYLVVKEPNGSLSAPLILEIFPESRLTFVVRDPRDVVASMLDAARKDSWYGYDRYESSLTEADFRGGRFVRPEPGSEEELVEQFARGYVANVSAVKRAYEAHPERRKVLVRYEDLRADPLKGVERIRAALDLAVDEEVLAAAVEKHAWENVPEERRGEGKFHRKATPGGWREDLTAEQARAVERISGPLLDEFYPGWDR